MDIALSPVGGERAAGSGGAAGMMTGSAASGGGAERAMRPGADAHESEASSAHVSSARTGQHAEHRDGEGDDGVGARRDVVHRGPRAGGWSGRPQTSTADRPHLQIYGSI